MKRTIGVFVGDSNRRVGTLRFDSQGARQSAAFEYTQEWLAYKNSFPLEPGLPLIAGPQFHKPESRDASVFHGAIADTEPDGWARRVILRDHARRRQAARTGGADDSHVLTPMLLIAGSNLKWRRRFWGKWNRRFPGGVTWAVSSE
jgi:serine/threonine-protein kinase HipA